MTHDTKPAPRRAFAADRNAGRAAAGRLLHRPCRRVLAMPAGRGRACATASRPPIRRCRTRPATGSAALPEPLWRVRAVEPDTAGEAAPALRAAAGSIPSAWLARLFGEGDDGGKVRAAGPVPGSVSGAGAGAGGAAGRRARAGNGRHRAGGAGIAARSARDAEPRDADPVRPSSSRPRPTRRGTDPAAGDLRTGEVVARIWIAPFVDADGVYREASHVRVVLEPAGWRLP